jgi:uncharacterized membrane protein YhaH (DUF805 family)
MNWFLLVLKKYAVFAGRSQRSEYWFFVLFYFLIAIVLSIADSAAGLMSLEAGIGLFSGLFMLAMFIPSLAVGVRRLHDIGRTGWWILIGLIPLIGWIVLLVFAVQDSQPGTNEYGPNPKEAAA